MTITKRNGKYYCRFQIDGERHHYLCSGATSIKEAEKLESQFKFKLQQQINGVVPRELDKITLNKLFKVYLKYSETNKKSYETDVCRVKVIKKFFGEQTLIKDIKPEKIENFKTYLLVDLERSTTTINRYLELLQTAFRMAIDNGWLLKNPCKAVSKFQRKNYSPNYLKEEDEDSLFDALPIYLKRIAFVALHSGLRKSNVLNLNWNQIKLDIRTMEILQNKGNKHMKIPINDALMQFFESYPPEERDGYLFINPETGLPYTDIKKAWNTAVEKAGIGHLRFHDLRHTVGTRLVMKGVPIHIIKDIMYHTDIKTTMQYLHYAEDEKLVALNKLSACD